MHWYNPKTSGVEDVPAPSTDEEAVEMLSGAPNSEALAEKYIELRRNGMGVEQAMIFVGHHWRMWHLRYQPVGYKAGSPQWSTEELLHTAIQAEEEKPKEGEGAYRQGQGHTHR